MSQSRISIVHGSYWDCPSTRGCMAAFTHASECALFPAQPGFETALASQPELVLPPHRTHLRMLLRLRSPDLSPTPHRHMVDVTESSRFAKML